jgi:hypothetical protein
LPATAVGTIANSSQHGLRALHLDRHPRVGRRIGIADHDLQRLFRATRQTAKLDHPCRPVAPHEREGAVARAHAQDRALAFDDIDLAQHVAHLRPALQSGEVEIDRLVERNPKILPAPEHGKADGLVEAEAQRIEILFARHLDRYAPPQRHQIGSCRAARGRRRRRLVQPQSLRLLGEHFEIRRARATSGLGCRRSLRSGCRLPGLGPLRLGLGRLGLGRLGLRGLGLGWRRQLHQLGCRPVGRDRTVANQIEHDARPRPEMPQADIFVERHLDRRAVGRARRPNRRRRGLQSGGDRGLIKGDRRAECHRRGAPVLFDAIIDILGPIEDGAIETGIAAEAHGDACRRRRSTGRRRWRPNGRWSRSGPVGCGKWRRCACRGRGPGRRRDRGTRRDFRS